MSGFGINVLKLKKSAGWMPDAMQEDIDPDSTDMTTLCDLVLIG